MTSNQDSPGDSPPGEDGQHRGSRTAAGSEADSQGHGPGNRGARSPAAAPWDSIHGGLALGVLLGIVLLRGVVLREMRLDDGVVENYYFASVLVDAYPRLLLEGLLPWAFGVFVATWRRPGTRALGAIPTALWIAFFASGRPFSGLEETLGFEGSAALRGWAVVGTASILAAIALASMPRWAPRGPDRPRGLRRVMALGSILLIALLPRAYLLAIPSPGDTFDRTRVVAELLFEEPPFEVLRAPDDAPPELGTLTPTSHNARDGADMYSLVLPPPASVLVRVPPGAGEATLRARAGLDHIDWQRARSRGLPLAIEFEVLLNGERVDHHVETYDFGATPPGSAWKSIGGAAGVAVTAGDMLEFRTSLPPGIEAPSQPIRAGFGGMTLEQYEPTDRKPYDPDFPNVVFIVMDTLRADRLTTYGYGRPTSPRLDRLAESGTLYEAAHSTSSWTWPSTASLFTGVEPLEHGVQGPSSSSLDHRLTTLAEAFQRLGYTTGAWANNPLIAPSRNFDQGFEHFVPATGFRRAYEMLDEPLAWLDVHRDDRFFLYLHLIDPHSPLLPSETARAALAAEVPGDFDTRRLQGLQFPLLYNGGFLEDGTPRLEKMVSAEEQQAIDDLYDACVRTGDEALGRVLDHLDALGIAEGTLVVFTSDHGEEIFEHGLATHGQGVHQELVHVPLVVAGPGVPRGRRVTTPVSNRRIGPAVLAHLGIEGFPGALPEGHVLFGEEGPGAGATVVSSTQRGWWNGRYPLEVIGVRDGPWMLHHAPRGQAWGGPRSNPLDAVKLFHLGRDPGEHEDLAPQETDRVRAMLVEYRKSARELETRAVGRRISGGANTEAMLERLGYADGPQDPGPSSSDDPPR